MGRHAKNRAPDPDVTEFQPVVAEFLKHLAVDYHYAEAMVKSAVSIERKREIAKAKRERRDAQAK